MSYQYNTICDLVKDYEKLDQWGETQISEYVTFDMRETLEKIDAYINSKHISGSTDSLGREKPFFNIVNAAVNIWYRATDIDRKNIRVLPEKSEQTTVAFMATILLQEWMRKNNFGKFLNEWGRTLAKYGSAVSKFVEKDGELISEIIPWNRILCDPVDFESNPVIEKIWLTPAQLMANKSYDQDFVKILSQNTTVRETSDYQKKDTKQDYILVYEIHGNLPEYFLTGNEKDTKYVQQMHVISLQAQNEGEDLDEYTLFKGREKKNSYHISHLVPEDGRTLAIGAVENLFEAQWMINHSAKQIKDQLDLASKILFQTADGNFVGQNALNNIENGDILIHAPSAPLTQLNNKPDIASMQSSMGQWQQQGLQVNGINEAMVQAPKSGTAWRQTAAALEEAHSLFELFTENKGLYIEEMLTGHIIPNLKKKMDTTDEVSTILDENQIEQIDEMYIPNEAKRRVEEQKNKTILSGEVYDPSQEEGAVASEEELLRKTFEPLKNQRFFKPSDIDDETWKEIMKDLEWDLIIDVTNESKDTQGAMATLTTVLQTLVSNPQALQDPNVKLVFGEILNLSVGMSPLQIKTPQNVPQELPQPSVQAPNPGAIPTEAQTIAQTSR